MSFPCRTSLFYYAIFFGFGALYHDARDDAGRVGRHWWLSLPLALAVVLPVGLAASVGIQETRELIGYAGQRLGSTFLQVLYAWLMIFGLIGLFRRFLSKGRHTIRFLSDSSYWLYLAHLPLIIGGQVLVRDWPLPGLVKMLLLTVVVTAFLLVTYRYGVRYTPLGWLLNGKRERPAT